MDKMTTINREQQLLQILYRPQSNDIVSLAIAYRTSYKQTPGLKHISLRC